jgi:hypothetical protein
MIDDYDPKRERAMMTTYSEWPRVKRAPSRLASCAQTHKGISCTGSPVREPSSQTQLSTTVLLCACGRHGWNVRNTNFSVGLGHNLGFQRPVRQRI